MAVISSCQILQQELPHMLIGSEAKLTRKLMKSMEDLPPSRLQLVRQKSAWCNAANLVDYFRKLQVALAPYMEILRPVVVLDVAPSHLPEAVMRGAQECGLELVFVPAGTTSIAQPLDVFGFRSFKAWLARELQLLRPSIPERSPISTKDLLGILRRAPTDFFGRRHWDKAFRCLGVGPPPHVAYTLKACFASGFRRCVWEAHSSAVEGNLSEETPHGTCARAFAVTTWSPKWRKKKSDGKSPRWRRCGQYYFAWQSRLVETVQGPPLSSPLCKPFFGASL